MILTYKFYEFGKVVRGKNKGKYALYEWVSYFSLINILKNKKFYDTIRELDFAVSQLITSGVIEL